MIRNMRAFIVLCLIGCSVSAPRVVNYDDGDGGAGGVHQPHQEYGVASFTPSQFAKDIQSSHVEPHYELLQQHFESYGNGNGIESSFDHQPQAHSFVSSIFDNTNSLPSSFAAEPIITKRFFIHSAPEEEAEVHHKTLTIGKARKNYNVVFIKTPAKSAPKTALKIQTAPNEDKTIIYVLSKKTENDQIDTQVYESTATTAKPEVYFIKYRTPEEAAHAQHTIQAQYDHLGGISYTTNEGIAPITSVIGSLDTIQHHSGAVADIAQPEPEDLYQPIGIINAQSLQDSGTTSTNGNTLDVSISGSNVNGYLPPLGYIKK